MITLYRPANYDNPRAQSLCGVSTDAKPLDVENGAEFREIDTGDRYRFDAENKVWIKQGDSAPTYQDGYESGYAAGVASVILSRT